MSSLQGNLLAELQFWRRLHDDTTKHNFLHAVAAKYSEKIHDGVNIDALDQEATVLVTFAMAAGARPSEHQDIPQAFLELGLFQTAQFLQRRK